MYIFFSFILIVDELKGARQRLRCHTFVIPHSHSHIGARQSGIFLGQKCSSNVFPFCPLFNKPFTFPQCYFCQQMIQNSVYHSLVLGAVVFSLASGENCISRISSKDVSLQSGDSISLDLLQYYFPDARKDPNNIARFIYVYDHHSETLTFCRDHVKVSVRDVLTGTHPLELHRPVPLTVNNIPKESVHLSNLRFDHAKSVSFLHESHSNRLLAILAPQFHLVRIKSTGENVILVDNTHRTKNRSENVSNDSLNLVSHMLQESTHMSPTNTATGLLAVRQSLQRKCTFSKKMEIDIMWDQSLCSQFDNDAKYTAFQIGGAIANVIPIFEISTCVSIVISSFHGFCKDGPRNSDPLGKMPFLDDCNKATNCRRPTKILEAVRNYWLSRKLYKYSPDASIFISGYDDGTSVVGAAYVGGACTNYKFGWVEKLRHQVISHEIGHLLGARHGKQGLMQSIIDIEKTSQLSKQSATEIFDFAEDESRGWCLDRDNWPRNNWTPFPFNASDVPDMSVSGDLEPESVYVIDSQYFWGIKFLMLIRNKTDPLAPLSFIQYERLSLSGEEFSNNTRFWRDGNTPYGPYKIPLDLKWPLVCAAITMSRFNLPIILMVQDKGSELTASYSLGDGGQTDQTSKEPKQWSTPLVIPLKFEPKTISSCSIAKIQNDLIFVFSKRLSTYQASIYYIIGKSVSADGSPSNGWTGLKQVPIAINGSVVAINILRTDLLNDGVDDLIFSYIMVDSKGKTNLKFIAGFELSADGTVEGGWSPEVELRPVQAGKVKQTSIGYAILVTPRWFKDSETGKRKLRNLPSIGFIDTLAGRDDYRLVIQHDALSNGIFNEAKIVENGAVIPACARCYTKRKANICVDSRLECSEAKATLPILENDGMKSRMTAKGVQTSYDQNRSFKSTQPINSIRMNGDEQEAGYPDNVGKDELYCAGVYKLFIEKSGGSCAGKISNAWIAIAGLAFTIEESLYDNLNNGGTNGTLIEPDVKVVFSWNGTTSDDTLDGAFAEENKKGPSQITVYSKNRLERYHIHKAIKEAHFASDYAHWFKDSRKKPRIRRKQVKQGPYTYLAIVDFPFAVIE